MIELHGVMFAGLPNINMKRRALFFDKFQIWRYVGSEFERSADFEAEIDFLKEKGIAIEPPLDANDYSDASSIAVNSWAKQTGFADSLTDPNKGVMVLATGVVMRDCNNRAIAAKVREKSDHDVVPICELELPKKLPNTSSRHAMTSVLTVASDIIPVPDESCAWEDIIDFKSEMKNKLWQFRRFLRDLAKKSQTKAEIRDDIEWTLKEYSETMRIHNLKAGTSFVEVSLIPAIEVIEDIAKFNIGKIAQSALSVKKREIELMEAEMKAPGRECAYVFETQKRFGQLT